MSGSMNKKAAVVGAGISGLYACYLLEKKGYAVDLFEQSDKIGGRMCSERKSGFIIDRGFHVLQTGYPTANRIFSYDSLGCKAFEPGALVIRPDPVKPKVWRFSDPFRRPLKGISSVLNLFTSPFNLMRVGLLRLKVSRISDADVFQGSGQSTFEFLRSKGFTEPFIKRFFLPLFSGIFLESDLRTDSRMFTFVFKNMSRGDMVLPEDGISAYPKQLYSMLDNTKLKLNTSVTHKSPTEVVVDEITYSYDIVIRAHSNADDNTTRGVWTLYFSAPKSPLKENYIMLNSSISLADNLISHLAVPSDIQPSYAPTGKSLIAVTVVEDAAKKRGLTHSDEVESAVLQELKNWFPEEIRTWQTLDVQHINSALPDHNASHYDNLGSSSNGISCGDFTFHGSVEGALISALMAVEKSIEIAAQR